ncbi:MAG TPA: FAD-dependent oxidoreductase, partial [Chitinophagaceae bacterium]|nr:FAD-dependent oxidoreductase [Chitinophagaceae bacterium]
NSYAKNTGFIISEEPVGTWWTQSERSGLLTGWLGGPRAAHLEGMKDAGIVQLALRSLAGIFNKTVEELHTLLVDAKVANWQKDPFSIGAYSYDTIHTAAARQLLRTPLENTLFFAGEALYEGVSPGTVEAALNSGAAVAQLLLHEKGR